ncbi:unnamed protein product [Lactuca virosa]|uniref:Uncharacterized protein n=1 Tax=Lactuca virosa TaxID=75947 RepID=A0AAU9NHA5_9ASTR|nr:unnamed protein product [Lactuca virosa]
MKTTAIPSRKRVASPPASPPPTNKSCRDPTWMPQIRAWMQEEDIDSCFEVGESSTAPTPTPYTPVEYVMYFLVPQTAHHSDCLGAIDFEIFLLRMTLRHLTERVKYLKEERDVMEMRNLLIPDQL